MKNAMLLAVVTGFLFAGFNALAEEAIDVGSRKSCSSMSVSSLKTMA